MSLPRPRALLFDWDNTLVDSWDSIHHALAVTFEAMGRTPWTVEETRARVRASAREAFPRLFGARAAEATEIFYSTFESDHLDKVKLRPGVTAMLERLTAAGLFLGVVSNKQGYLLRREAVHLELSPFFGRLVGASDAPRDKPAVEPVELALASSGVARGPETWFVGDTDIDMVCAVNAGCVPVLLRGQPPEADEFAAAPPRIYAKTCADLAELVISH